MTRLLLGALVALTAALPSQVPLTVATGGGAPAFDFYGEGPYRAAVPRPDSLLGYPLGTRHTMYHQQQAVLDAMVAAAPDRARFEVTGTTAEGKLMRVLVIGSPASLARLETIRHDLAELADPRQSDATRAAAIIRSTPAVAFLSHSIHGNEPAGFEAALMTAYTLLASESPRITRLLDSVVVILNPAQNPDGHERFAAWSNSVATGRTEGAALESRRSEPWSIQGRFNHYRFDMNRDLLALSQPETRATAAAVLRWHPQVLVDLHSTTSQYFFAPPAPPVNANLPASSVRWMETFGRGNAAAFDGYGWQYYVRDVFDLFYPGYWDTWPSLLGATGMTFESDGGPLLRTRKDDGSVTTFREGIAHHFVASMATLATLAAHRTARLTDYRAFFTSALVPPAAGTPARVVLLPTPDEARTRELVELLRFQGIEVTEASAPFTVERAHDYLGGGARRREFPRGAFVVDLVQPQGRLARALLEPVAALDSAFARRQLDRFERNRRRGSQVEHEGYEFYDITAWALPLTHGIDAAWTVEPVAVEPVDPADRAAFDLVPLGRARSGYLIPPGTRNAQVLTLALLAEDFRLGVATLPLVADGRRWPEGTVVLRTVRNADSLHPRLVALQRRFPTAVIGVESAFPDSGQTGIGSESVRPVARPRILIAAGEGIDQPEFGDLWWYLERELHQAFVAVDPSALAGMALEEYNVLILPGGRYGRSLDTAGLNALRDWVRGGGVLIAIGGATAILDDEAFGLRTAVEEAEEGDLLTVADTALSPSAAPGPIASPGAAGNRRPEHVPGAIGLGTLDPLHWLRWGYPGDELAVPIPGRFLPRTRDGANVVVFEGPHPVLAGFSWPDNTEPLLSGTAWATVDRAGRGTVVAFAANPLFRGFWRGPAMLLVNAILHGSGR